MIGAKLDFNICRFREEVESVLKRSFNNQRSNSKKYDRSLPSYTFEQFYSWSYENGFPELFLKWKQSGKPSDLPSLDRVDSLEGYSFENCEWVTWQENRRRQSEDAKNGVGSSGRLCRPVLRTKDVYIGSLALVETVRFVSVAEATRKATVKVSYYLKNGKTDRNGHRWTYET